MSGIDISGMMHALAELKKIPVEKVLRNAGRDFLQGAQKATPTAQISKSQYNVATDGKKKWYIHESQLSGTKIKKSSGKIKISKVRIKKGWSKSTWIGAMRALGMTTKNPPKRLNASVMHKSTAVFSVNAQTGAITIADEFKIDNFGKQGTATQHNRIAQAGFALAAKRIFKEFTRMIKEKWKNDNR